MVHIPATPPQVSPHQHYVSKNTTVVSDIKIASESTVSKVHI